MNAKQRFQSHRMNALKKEIFYRLALLPLFIVIFLLLPAGSFNFWEVYIYFIILIIPMLYILFYFFKNDPEFLERRMKMKEKESRQKKIVVIYSIAYISVFLIPGFDHRFGWSYLPFELIIIADLMVLLSYIFIILVFKENHFASRVVEIDEKQTVITTGPYRYIRHPMYSGILVMLLATPIALGSYWALIPTAVIPFSLVFRILNEEKILSEQLAGYTEYCQKTPYRLIPYIW
jgi:protein-S-isoprenylcysteine O-methyltransferase Ste14